MLRTYLTVIDVVVFIGGGGGGVCRSSVHVTVADRCGSDT